MIKPLAGEFRTIKNFLQNLLIFFALALCALVAFQWVRETDLRKRLQTRSDAIHDRLEDIQRLQGDVTRDETEIQRLDALQTANDNIQRQNEQTRKQNDELARLGEDRNDAVRKFNKMTADYDDLAARWNKQQEELAKAATNAAAKNPSR